MNELIEKLEERYGLVVMQPDLLKEAMTHSSYANEHRPAKYNEKLEFLGDAVLELNISDFLYKSFPELDEGQLTQLRSEIVQTKSFASFTRALGLEKFLLLGRGESKNGAREKDTILENLFEAFFGFLHLEFGEAGVQKVLKKDIFPIILSGKFHQRHDYKTILQEELQKNGDIKIEYKVTDDNLSEESPAYFAKLIVNDNYYSGGSGSSKKEAEQSAAKAYLEKLGKKGEI